MKRKRDVRYAAFIVFALIFVVVFFVYNRNDLFGPRSEAPNGAVSPFPGFPVDINSADIEALRLLPGVGTKTAEAIIAERQKKGKFASIKDIQKVRGIGEQKFEALKGYITIKKDGLKGQVGRGS